MTARASWLLNARSLHGDSFTVPLFIELTSNEPTSFVQLRLGLLIATREAHLVGQGFCPTGHGVSPALFPGSNVQIHQFYSETNSVLKSRSTGTIVTAEVRNGVLSFLIEY